MNHSLNSHVKDTRKFIEWVWFTGATALSEGQGLCYDTDYGTATAADGRRVSRVELPSSDNNMHFAGVAARDYSAKDNGQFIEIYRPGSVCNILVGASVTLDTGIITCQAGGDAAGQFTQVGFLGEGSAVPLQTVDGSSTATTCLAELLCGQPSGLVEVLEMAPAGGAITCMVGGKTFFDNAVTLAADATYTLADATVPGLRKGFECLAAMTTNDIVVTVTNGEQRDGATALATASFDAADEKILLEWADGAWVEVYSTGATLA